VKRNDVIYFDDGKVVAQVMEVQMQQVRLEVKVGGIIKSNCGVRLTGGKHTKFKLIQEQDIEDL